MNLDQPEAQAYFGMKNKTSCSKCRRRKGRSAHRRARTQSGVVVNRLYNIVDQVDAPDETRTLAAQKLMRWGFSPEKRCLLTTICKSLLVRIPGQDEVFPCVDFRDKLHGLMSFLFRAFDKIFEKLPLSTNLKTLLEQRLLWICHHGCLRNPKTKRAYRVQRTLFNAANLGTVDKVCILFLLPHVLGHKASVLPENVRNDLLGALSVAQQMVIAIRDNRSYTEHELDEIFNRGYITLFRHLESINAMNTDTIFQRKMTKHQQNPDRYPAPKRFKRQDRSYMHVTNFTPKTPDFKSTHTRFASALTPVFKSTYTRFACAKTPVFTSTHTRFACAKHPFSNPHTHV